MELRCKIRNRIYNITVGETFAEEFNETLDSGTIIIPQVKKIFDLSPYDDVYIWNAYDSEGNIINFGGYYNKGDQILENGVALIAQENRILPSTITFFKHLLVDNFQEEQIALDDEDGEAKYNYTIHLMSETKGLDVVPCPNVSVTQSLIAGQRRTCYEYLNNFINLYSPKVKVKSLTGDTWTYQQKYKIDPNGSDVDGSVQQIFGNVNCPEMTWTNPTLRDILSQIMIVCDCIPVVRNGVIYAMNISKTTGTFRTDPDHHNYVHTGMNSADFATAARREYSGALSQTTSQCIEYLGFRNREEAILTIENMYLETRFPIYKINKLVMCYYKYAVVDGQNKPFLCEQDITDLVLQNNVRNALSADWSQYPQQISSRADMANWKVLTLGYDIGSNRITGWGTKYQYATWAWFSETKTYIENIVLLLDRFNQFGNNTSYAKIALGKNYNQVTGISIHDNMDEIIGPENLTGSAKLKSVFFKIDYEAMYDGALIHSKENADRDDIAIVDNQSSALTLTERDGLFEYSKLKRLGNRQVKIQARFDSVEQMNNEYNNVIGAIYGDNVIIYHKEYQIYDGFVLANFVGTYSYVLRDYFTSVFARLRTYNYMSYQESVKRAETDKKYLVLSTDKLYYENNDTFLLDKNSLMTAVTETVYNASLVQFENPYYINVGYMGLTRNGQYSKYLSDLQRLISGYSLAFDIKMFDNIAAGVHITNWQAMAWNKDSGQMVPQNPYSEYDQFSDGDLRKAIRLQGSAQDWYIMPESTTDAFIGAMDLYIGHEDTQNISLPTDENTVKSIYQGILNDLPKTSSNNIQNIMGGLYQLNKDNKELIDMTFQIELYNKNVWDLFVSNWFLKLCDLYGEYIKSQRDKEYNSPSAVNGVPFTMLYGTRTSAPAHLFYPDGIIVFRIFENDVNYLQNGIDILSIENTKWVFVTSAAYIPGPSSQGNITKFYSFRPIQIVSISNDRNTIAVRFAVEWANKDNMSETGGWTYDIALVRDSESKPGYVDYKFDGILRDFYNDTLYIATVDRYEDFPEHTKDANISNSQIWENNFYLQVGSSPYTLTQLRNMYFSYAKSGSLDFNQIKREQYSSIPSDFTIIDTTNYSVIELINDHTMRINFNLIDPNELEDVTSVQYWFYNDKDDQLYHLVFSVNITNEDKAAGYKDIFVSLIKSKDNRVFDYLHRDTYQVINYIEHQELNYNAQRCEMIVIIAEGSQLYYEIIATGGMGIPRYSVVGDDNNIYSIGSYYVMI